MIASEDAKNPLQFRKQKGIQGYGLAISDWKKGMKWWNQGSLRRHKCNVRRIRCIVSPVYIGQLPPFSQAFREEGRSGATGW
ncbi:MAG: hypothetical protein CL920_36705 [Deltaproteobacteria bacterium]|nr:hypothetical protein [Deltaproteobacteria bacterium]